MQFSKRGMDKQSKQKKKRKKTQAERFVGRMCRLVQVVGQTITLVWSAYYGFCNVAIVVTGFSQKKKKKKKKQFVVVQVFVDIISNTSSVREHLGRFLEIFFYSRTARKISKSEIINIHTECLYNNSKAIQTLKSTGYAVAIYKLVPKRINKALTISIK